MVTPSQCFANEGTAVQESEYEIADLLPLSRLARLVPSRSGKGVHASTIWRWSTGAEPRLRALRDAANFAALSSYAAGVKEIVADSPPAKILSTACAVECV